MVAKFGTEELSPSVELSKFCSDATVIGDPGFICFVQIEGLALLQLEIDFGLLSMVILSHSSVGFAIECSHTGGSPDVPVYLLSVS